MLDSGSQPSVFLVAPYGAAARYLFRTGILDALLSAGVKVVALVPNPDEDYIRTELGQRGVVVERLRAPDAPRGRLWTTFVYLRQNTLGGRVQTLRERHRNARRELAGSRPAVSRALDLVIALLRRSRLLRKALLRLEERLYRPRLHRDLFSRHRPSLVVVTSPGWFLADAVLLREAAREGVRTAALVLGWDNPTSKGYRGARVDAVVAWSDPMARQLVTHHDVARRTIVRGGVPQFDLYRRPDALRSREDLFRELGLDPARRLILFAGRSPSTYSHNETVAGVLAEAMRDGRLSTAAQLVVRPHPINFRADHRLSLSGYMKLADEFDHVTIDVPAVASDSLSCDVPESDFRRLAALLAHCDVLVNAFSTTTLEAFLLDTPVVLVSDKAHRAAGMRGDAPEARRFSLDTHMEPVLSADAARVAETYEELIVAVDAYLLDPGLEAPARRRVTAEECPAVHGGAGPRIGDFLARMAGSASALVQPGCRDSSASVGGGADVLTRPTAGATTDVRGVV